MRITYSAGGDARISKDGVTITVKNGAVLAPDVLITALSSITDVLDASAPTVEDMRSGV